MEDNTNNNMAEYNQNPSVEDNFNHQTTTINVQISNEELIGLTKWAKFRAIMDIIFGALACIGFITAIYGVPQIIAGVKLLNSVNSLREYMNTNDQSRIRNFFEDNRKFFLFSGTAIIIRVVCVILLMVLYIGIIAVFISNFNGQPGPEIDNFFKQFGNMSSNL